MLLANRRVLQATFLLIMILGTAFLLLKPGMETIPPGIIHPDANIQLTVKAQEDEKPHIIAVNETVQKPLFDESFNNVTGADHLIVPNLIHYVRFNKTEYSFVEYVCLRAAFRNQRPDFIYIHTDVGEFTGKYWSWVKNEPELWTRIRIIPTELPIEVFGQKLSTGWRFFHGSDFVRLHAVQKFGGIYLDNDVFVIKSLDKYRKFEAVVNWDENQFLGNQLIIAHKDARILKPWIETYKLYRSDLWYYNGDFRHNYYMQVFQKNLGERPTTEILYHHPDWIHRVKGAFGADTGVSMRLYHDNNFNWQALDAIHLLMNHRSYMDPHYKETPVFNEINIKTYKYPFGAMAREIMDYNCFKIADKIECIE